MIRSARAAWMSVSALQLARFAVAVALVLTLQSVAWAQGPLRDAPRPALDVPRAADAPALDARENDPAWQAAASLTSLAPSFGGDFTEADLQPTTVRVMWDEQYLYVRFECVDAAVVAPFGDQRDADHYTGDVSEVFLDPVGDGRAVYELQVTPAGGVLDLLLLLTAEPELQENGALAWSQVDTQFWSMREWNMPGLRSAARRHEPQGDRPARWVSEFAIPAEVILRRTGRKALSAGATMRANFLRYDYAPTPPGQEARLIASNWSPVQLGCPHISAARMGELRLVEASRPQTRPE